MAAQLHPARDWMPNRSLNSDVTNMGCSIMPCLVLMMKVKMGTFGRLLFPSRNRFGMLLNLSITLVLILFSS